MSFNLESLSTGKAIRAPRIVLLGVEKIGKTCFACGCQFADGKLTGTGINAPVVIPMRGEEGADDLEVAKFPTAGTVEDVETALASLYEGKHEFRTVVLDSASAMEPLVWADVCQKHNVKGIEDVGGGYGKGYIEAASRWRDILNGLDALRNERGLASVIIGHVKVKRFDDPTGDSYDTYTFDLNEKAANLIFRWADLILFANTKVVVKKEDKGFGQKKLRGVDATGGQRFLFTQKRPSHPGGGRGIYGQLPYELPLDWAEFEAAVGAITAGR